MGWYQRLVDDPSNHATKVTRVTCRPHWWSFPTHSYIAQCQCGWWREEPFETVAKIYAIFHHEKEMGIE